MINLDAKGFSGSLFLREFWIPSLPGNFQLGSQILKFGMLIPDPILNIFGNFIMLFRTRDV